MAVDSTGALAIRGLRKSYASVTVLKDVDLAVAGGEIHALLGANGAGKSTLIKCVSGAVVPDAGQILLDGQDLTLLSPAEARRAGAAVIYQEFSLAPTLSVSENVFLGRELRAGPFLRRRAQTQATRRMLDSLGAGHIRAGVLVGDLSGANQQVVEIAKALQSRPRLLILDEPTASLTQLETDLLMQQLRQLKAHGLPIVYVTHRLPEVKAIADRVTVLRDGAVTLSADAAEVDEADLVRAITGASIASDSDAAPAAAAEQRPVLAVRDLTAAGIGPVTFSLAPGEVLGVYGLLGSGRSELLEAIMGARGLLAGDVLLDDETRRFRRPADAIAAGIALVPSDRRRQALFRTLSALDNLLMPSLGRLSRFGLRRRAAERRTFDATGKGLGLVPLRPGLEVQRFSGGNQQKVSVGRWLAGDRTLRVLLLDEPTQGVDVGARRQLYGLLRDLAHRQGLGVLITSSDAEELELVADRVVVLSRGHLVGELRGGDIAEFELVRLAHAEGDAP